MCLLNFICYIYIRSRDNLFGGIMYYINLLQHILQIVMRNILSYGTIIDGH